MLGGEKTAPGLFWYIDIYIFFLWIPISKETSLGERGGGLGVIFRMDLGCRGDGKNKMGKGMEGSFVWCVALWWIYYYVLFLENTSYIPHVISSTLPQKSGDRVPVAVEPHLILFIILDEEEKEKPWKFRGTDGGSNRMNEILI